jgi:hypothetical protein
VKKMLRIIIDVFRMRGILSKENYKILNSSLFLEGDQNSSSLQSMKNE